MSTSTVAGFVVEVGSSRRRAAQLRKDAQQQLWVLDESEPCGFVSELDVPDRVGNTARFIRLPDGRGFETSDNDALDVLLRSSSGSPSLAHRLEKNLKFVALAAVCLVVIMGLVITEGVPQAGDLAARFVSDEVRIALGDSALNQLDGEWFSKSDLSDETQRRLTDVFRRLSTDTERPTRLVFRAGNALGANALTLPDGIVFVTDELASLADADDQLSAVLLHELAHIEFDHGMRNVLRQAGLSVLVLAFTGDVSTGRSLIIMLPTLMLSLQYSREFEVEAD